jgi:hypothetical protein
VVAAVAHDRRWVRIRRPVVMVGGELTLDMLDLRFNPTARFYEAPIQLKANGGVFLVDDFGRQRMRPQDLLNRWIVPLESRIDHLTLHSGKKFVVPFDTLVVFATNLPPESLADEAFLRRIPYKIAIEDPSLDEFTKIFELNCKRRNMRFHQVMVAYLQRRHYKPSGRPLRACHPRDLLDQVSALCRYRGVEPTITRELLDAACKSYFVGEAPDAAAARDAEEFGQADGRALMDVSRRHRLTDLLARVTIGALSTLLSINILADFLRTGRLTGLLLLSGEVLVVVLTIMRRPADAHQPIVRAGLVTLMSVAGPPMLRTGDAPALAPDLVTTVLSAIGLAIAAVARRRWAGASAWCRRTAAWSSAARTRWCGIRFTSATSSRTRRSSRNTRPCGTASCWRSPTAP